MWQQRSKEKVIIRRFQVNVENVEATESKASENYSLWFIKAIPSINI
jgi:hypothetical protein